MGLGSGCEPGCGSLRIWYLRLFLVLEKRNAYPNKPFDIAAGFVGSSAKESQQPPFRIMKLFTQNALKSVNNNKKNSPAERRK